MISTNTANPNPSSDPKVIFQNQDYTLRYSGPPLTEVERVVMTFPHRIHPPGTNVAGWGERFLRKRGAAVLSVLFEKVDWYQSPGFFPAMDAARAFLGDKIAITTYGSSMGAYGAILAAGRLRADRVVAACPQFSIESDVAPFERRFRVEADEIGPFLHDVNGELRDDISYFVLHDPTHKIDHRHVALFSKPMNWENILFPGTGHNTLPAMTDAGMKDTVFALLMGQMDGRGVRQEIRERRGNSIYYIRRMGNLCSKFPQRVRGRAVFIDIARKRGLRKFVHKWTKADAAYQTSSKAPSIAAGRGPGELIIHVGLPNTEAIGIQTYFAREVDAIRSLGVDYPLGVSGRTPHHGWFGKSLLSGDFSELDRVLAQSPSPRMLLSDETIYNEAAFCEDATADALRERLAGRNLRVIACLRDGDSWMKSFYKQAVQNKGRGDATGSAAYWGSGLLFDAFFANPEIAMLARSSDMLARLERIFGVQVETIEMRPDEDIVPVFLEKIGLPTMENGLKLEANPGLTDLDVEILRQANMQGGRAHGFMRLLLDRVPEEEPVDLVARNLRSGRRSLLTDMVPQFDWAALSYVSNPPLHYERDGFDQRCAALQARAEALHEAILTQDVQA